MSDYLNKEYWQKFKVGDYLYLDSRATTQKLKSQEVINIKLGVRNVIKNTHLPTSMYKVTSIIKNKLFFNTRDIISIQGATVWQ